MLLSTSVVVATLLFGQSAFAVNGKRVFLEDITSRFDPVFWNYLKPTQSHWDSWDWGWIPKSCLERIQEEGFSPYDVEVFNVHYTDCDTTWTMCRHHNADLSQIDMIDLFGRLPAGYRGAVRHVIAVSHGGGAYMNGGDIIFKGHATPSIFIHEAGHAADFQLRPDHGVNGPTSSTNEFRGAVAKDTCDASPANYGEDYAELCQYLLYEIVSPGGLDPLGNWRCLENQKNVAGNLMKGYLTPGDRCSHRVPDSPPVSMGPASGNGKRSVGHMRDEHLQLGQRDVVATPVHKGVDENDVELFGNMVFNETARQNAITMQEQWQAEWIAQQQSKRMLKFEA
ncbi:hypothetical protein B0O99DRAFT_622603 [Bisporella sp. PMI_857]|nr:hypothetical protein B0O99DRAFT_622603 [Bisporella sp. PMI_857]